MGKRFSTVAKKRSRPPKRKLNNKIIVIMKISASSLLFFACCLFFFQNMTMFWSDLKTFNPFPIVFFAGVIWICLYIANLVGHIEDKDLFLADKYDWLYKIVSTVTIIAIAVRSLLMRSLFTKELLRMPAIIIILCITSGIATLLTPKIIDNDNNDF